MKYEIHYYQIYKLQYIIANIYMLHQPRFPEQNMSLNKLPFRVTSCNVVTIWVCAILGPVYMFIYGCIFILCVCQNKNHVFECFGTKKDSQPIQEKSHSVSTSPWLLSGEGTKLWGCLDKHPQHLQRSICCPLVKSLSAKSEKNKSG